MGFLEFREVDFVQVEHFQQAMAEQHLRQQQILLQVQQWVVTPPTLPPTGVVDLTGVVSSQAPS